MAGLSRVDPRVEEVGGSGPSLETAPNLLYNLGLCIAVSSTRQVSQVKLPYPAPGGPALSTNLILISQEGSAAFLGAYGDLLEISSAAEELCEPSGLLDQLAMVLTNGTKKKSTETTVVGWVQDRVKKSVKSGETISGNLHNWKASVNALQLALMTAQSNTTNEISYIADAAAGMTGLQKNNQGEIQRTRQQIRLGESRVYSNLETYNRRLTDHESMLQVQTQDYLQSPLYAAITRPLKWIARNEHDTAAAMAEKRALRLEAEEDVSRAQRELDRHRREQQALNVLAHRIQADLEAFSAKTMKLNEIFKTIELVCGLIAGLTEDIGTLLTKFENLSKDIDTLTTLRGETIQTKPGGFKIGSKVFNPFGRKDVSSLQPTAGPDKEVRKMMYLFKIRKMKRVCININVLATLYADAIQTVIKEGFSAAAQCSWNRMGQTDEDSIYEMRRRMMQQWQIRATQRCVRMTRDAAQTMNTRLDASERDEPMQFSGTGFAADSVSDLHTSELSTVVSSGRVFLRSPTSGRAYEAYEADSN
ncbi:hypothetical protein QBC47DRAFT_386279 [Echria macrotheca]|uniref:Uncharacterized protein n=1 Tax=Echria macrotheca TaxID=438768 RepID=A0AAJ0F7J0_9PEZI|nr:hypothetical protein QBC47DRAFT_386279 [Echria macrotheca]